MKIHSYNEWDRLREIIVGRADHANWPTNDPVFAKESEKTTWTHSAVPSGAVPQWIIDETNDDLEALVVILEQADVEVHRPLPFDYQKYDGMYGYCPRDRFLIAGDAVVDPVMMYPCRDQEVFALDLLVQHGHRYIAMPRGAGMIMDAANVCRLGDQWLYLESPSGNRAAYDWLCSQFPHIKIEICNFYAGVHIDSTVVPLREGTVLLNAGRVTPENCPRVFDGWEKIWVEDCVPQDFYQYPYASKWIGMNCLSISPDTVIVDAAQTEIITRLERMKFTVIPHTLRHSRTLGGGFHCVTLDTWREP